MERVKRGKGESHLEEGASLQIFVPYPNFLLNMWVLNKTMRDSK